jgi:hypothetical protein
LKRAWFVDRRLRLKSYYRPDFHEIARAHIQLKYNSDNYNYYQVTIRCVRPRTSSQSGTNLQFPQNAYYNWEITFVTINSAGSCWVSFLLDRNTEAICRETLRPDDFHPGWRRIHSQVHQTAEEISGTPECRDICLYRGFLERWGL